MQTTPNYPMASRASASQKMTQMGWSPLKGDTPHRKFPEEVQEDDFIAAFKRNKPFCKKCFFEHKGRSHLPQWVSLGNHL